MSFERFQVFLIVTQGTWEASSFSSPVPPSKLLRIKPVVDISFLSAWARRSTNMRTRKPFLLWSNTATASKISSISDGQLIWFPVEVFWNFMVSQEKVSWKQNKTKQTHKPNFHSVIQWKSMWCHVSTTKTYSFFSESWHGKAHAVGCGRCTKKPQLFNSNHLL